MAMLLTLVLTDSQAESDIAFEAVSGACGVQFEHISTPSDDYYLPEIMGSGVALVDYDKDGLLDIYLVQSGVLKGENKHGDRVFRNVFEDGRCLFEDVTSSLGIVSNGYGMGVTIGDVDNDTWPDIYINNFGENQLFRNTGDGKFENWSGPTSGLPSDWSVSSVFADLDNDGDQDLYVGNYVGFSIGGHKVCRSSNSEVDYCSPDAYKAQRDRFFRNLGHGEFRDDSLAVGLNKKSGAALGVIAGDFTGNGNLDVLVANDGDANQLWELTDEKWSDIGDLAGIAVNMQGATEASMGIAVGDVDNDGDDDLFMTHLNRETNTLYVNQGDGWFTDKTVRSGLAEHAYALTGFGTGFFDFDLDGDLDLFVSNGAVTKVQPGNSFLERFAQPDYFYENNGSGQFKVVKTQATDLAPQIGRGVALGDLDNDGDTDIVVSNNNGPAQIFLNQMDPDRWVGIQLQATDAQAQHAKIVMIQSDGTRTFRTYRRDGSYGSSSDPRVVFGLSGDRKPQKIKVFWADGTETELEKPGLGRYYVVKKPLTS